VLTLYTTPVIYIFFDKLGKRVTGHSPSDMAGDSLSPDPEQA
jgi:multidrug efflux pump